QQGGGEVEAGGGGGGGAEIVRIHGLIAIGAALIAVDVRGEGRVAELFHELGDGCFEGHRAAAGGEFADGGLGTVGEFDALANRDVVASDEGFPGLGGRLRCASEPPTRTLPPSGGGT